MEKKTHVRKILRRCLRHVEKRRRTMEGLGLRKNCFYFDFLRLKACRLALLLFGL
jgi:hypothetical protein